MGMNIEGVPDQPFGARLLREYAKALEGRERGEYDTERPMKASVTWDVNGVKVSGVVHRDADYRQAIRHKRPPKLIEAILLDTLMDFVPAHNISLFFESVRHTLDYVEGNEAYEEYMKSQAKNVEWLRVFMDAQKEMTITDCKGQTRCDGKATTQKMAVLHLPSLFDLAAQTEGIQNE